MREFIINVNDAEQRLDKFINKAAPLIPKSLLYKSIRTKNVKLNGKRCYPETFLCEGDTLRIYLSDEFFAPQTETLEFENSFSKLKIVYEDKNILVANKPQGQLSHGENSLLNAVTAYLIQKGEFSPRQENSFRPALCNRLDRNTRGLIIAAKNANALRLMDEGIRERKVVKIYLCEVINTPRKLEDTVTLWLKKDAKLNKVIVSETPCDGYKESVTRYKVIEKNTLEVELLTGRTHQIRAVLSHLGSPLKGDVKYGGGLGEMNLCSYSLQFKFDGGELEYLNAIPNSQLAVKPLP